MNRRESTFEQWINRPVYKVQCRTFKVLLDILNIPHIVGDRGIATSVDHPIAHFRVFPKYRGAFSVSLRNKVAEAVRAQRKAA